MRRRSFTILHPYDTMATEPSVADRWAFSCGTLPTPIFPFTIQYRSLEAARPCEVSIWPSLLWLDNYQVCYRNDDLAWSPDVYSSLGNLCAPIDMSSMTTGHSHRIECSLPKLLACTVSLNICSTLIDPSLVWFVSSFDKLITFTPLDAKSMMFYSDCTYLHCDAVVYWRITSSRLVKKVPKRDDVLTM